MVSNYIESSGSTFMTESEFLKLAIKDLNLPEKKVTIKLQEAKERYNNSDNYQFNKFDLVSSDSIISTGAYWTAETNIATQLIASKSFLVKPFPGFNQKLNNFLEIEGFEPSQEQLSIFHSVNDYKISLLIGSGGTGKTFTASNLIKFLKNTLKKKVALIAPTGKASKRLKDYSGFEAKTIHSYFGFSFEDEEGTIVKFQGSGFSSDNVPDIIVIDEFSMVDSLLLNNILKELSKEAFSNTRLLLLGDEYQIPSVSPGNVLHSLIKFDIINTVRLTKVYRVTSGYSGISKISNYFRQGKFPYRNEGNLPQVVDKDCVIQNIEDNDRIIRQVLQAYNKILNAGGKPEEIMVLSATNAGEVGQANLNKLLKEAYHTYLGNKIEETYFTHKVSGVDHSYHLKDLVLFLKNRSFFKNDGNYAIATKDEYVQGVDLEEKVMNGDTGEVIAIGNFCFIVKLHLTGKEVIVFKEDLKDLQLGYSYTIHKSQGSESPYGIMVVPNNTYYQLSSNLLYTGASRFKKRLYLFGSFRTIRSRVSVFANKERKTILDKILEDKSVYF